MDAENLKKKLSPHDIPNGFIKVTDKPVQTLSSEQKALLNRKGNVLFNEGKIIEACRIFVTTGYSDGLTRVGDFYLKKNLVDFCYVLVSEYVMINKPKIIIQQLWC